MGGVTSYGTGTGAELVQEMYGKSLTNCIYYNPMLGFVDPQSGREVFPKTLSAGGRYTNWLVRRSGGAPEVFLEGQVQPEPSNSLYSVASVAPVYLRSVVMVTGHAMDALRSARVQGMSHL